MHRTARPRRRVVVARRKTNWPIIFLVIALGVITLGVLLYLSTRETPPPRLADYCDRNPDRCIELGNPDADVTVVEISDYGCPHCRTYNEETASLVVDEFVDTGKVRYLVLPYALRLETVEAASAALCAAEQDLFGPMHDALFALQDGPAGFSRTAIMNAGTQVGLDTRGLATCLNEERYLTFVERNIQAASQSGVTGTPAFFLNGEILKGPQPIAVFRQRIETLLDS